MFSPNVEPQPLQAIAIAAAKKALADSHDGDELIDERSIPRDLCSMRSASITTSINPPLTSRPAGLLTAEDARVGRKHDAPRLSLAEEVSLAMDDGSSKVKSFLQSIGLEHLEELFITQEIDFETIPSLTEEDLEKIGITKLGVRKKIMRGVRQLSNGFGSRSPPSSETSYRTDSMSIVMKESSRGTRSGSRSIMSAMSIDVSEQSAFSVVQRSRSSSIMD